MALQRPQLHSGSGSDAPAAPPPLLLVPGVCGTQLAVRPEGTTGDGERCWVTLRGGADAAYQKLWGKFDSGTGRVRLLLPGLEACVPQGGDESGLFAISVLDPDVGFAVKAVHYFEPLITFLQAQGYAPGSNLFGAGYDFRQSCRASARTLLVRLQDVSRRCGGRRVDVVTHSMGGLVVRSLLSDFPAEFEALVGRWVALGCPFGGAPGYTLDGLITGVQFGGSLGDFFFVQRDTFRQAACQSPAVYELLPPLDFPFTQPPPQLTLWLKVPIPEVPPGEGDGEVPLLCTSHTAYTLHSPVAAAAAALPLALSSDRPAAPQLPRLSLGSTSSAGTRGCAGSSSNKAHKYIFHHDVLPGLLARLLKDNTGSVLHCFPASHSAVSVQGASIPLPFDPELWALGQATHEAWKAARLPPSCCFFNLYGTALSTPYDVQYGAWWYAVQDLEAVPHAAAAFTYVDGDATVPAESATAHGLQATASVAVKGAHRDLVGMQEVWDQVLAWLQAPAPSVVVSSSTSISSGAGASSSRIAAAQQHCSSVPAVEPWTAKSPQDASVSDQDEFWNPLVWRAMLR